MFRINGLLFADARDFRDADRSWVLRILGHGLRRCSRPPSWQPVRWACQREATVNIAIVIRPEQGVDRALQFHTCARQPQRSVDQSAWGVSPPRQTPLRSPPAGTRLPFCQSGCTETDAECPEEQTQTILDPV